MERFVTVDEFSLGWNPVRRCAQNRKILRQRENHVVCGGGKGAAFGGSRRAPYKGTIMPNISRNFFQKRKAGMTEETQPLSIRKIILTFFMGCLGQIYLTSWSFNAAGAVLIPIIINKYQISWAHFLFVREWMRSGICAKWFQASQHAFRISLRSRKTLFAKKWSFRYCQTCSCGFSSGE